MKKGSMLVGCLSCVLAGALLTACAEDDAQIAPPAVPAAAPTYVTNTTYNNSITYNTVAAASSSSTPPPVASEIAPQVTIVQTPSEAGSSVISPRIVSIGGARRDMRSTGVPECDAYLDRVESCSAAMLSAPNQSEGLDRITFSLDMARRSWRHVAEMKSERGELARTCADAMTLYNSSAKAACP